jgi:putative flavoprotein involved in K+ transport
VRHDGGVTSCPGIYLIGANFLRRRGSSLIDGVGKDAKDLTAHMAGYLSEASPASWLVR